MFNWIAEQNSLLGDLAVIGIALSPFVALGILVGSWNLGAKIADIQIRLRNAEKQLADSQQSPYFSR